MIRYFVFLLLLFTIINASGQTSVLESYVNEGIENNLALKQQNLDYKQSLYAIEEARSYFFPQVSINARATFASGGRTIDFPVGDLMNPVYSTLNTLTASNNFPQVENEQIQFVRPFEQETKISLVQPVFNPSIYYNTRIQKNLPIQNP
ncbi:MAG: TolC family protein [Chloroflexia bacterium]|nr:TolC family protein [Chloroflexia bacterium]